MVKNQLGGFGCTYSQLLLHGKENQVWLRSIVSLDERAAKYEVNLLRPQLKLNTPLQARKVKKSFRFGGELRIVSPAQCIASHRSRLGDPQKCCPRAQANEIERLVRLDRQGMSWNDPKNPSVMVSFQEFITKTRKVFPAEQQQVKPHGKIRALQFLFGPIFQSAVRKQLLGRGCWTNLAAQVGQH